MTDPKLFGLMQSLDNVVFWLRLPHDAKEHESLLGSARYLIGEVQTVILEAARSRNYERVGRKKKRMAKVIGFPRNPQSGNAQPGERVDEVLHRIRRAFDEHVCP